MVDDGTVVAHSVDAIGSWQNLWLPSLDDQWWGILIEVIQRL
jgi:hypothetical protein